MILVPQSRIDEFTAAGWWETTTLDERFMARVAELGDGEAVVDPLNLPQISGRPQRRLSWNELADEVSRAAALLYGLGLRKDDAVVVQLPNSVDQFTIYLACARLGIIVSPVPAQYRQHEIAYAVGATEAKALITTERIGRFAHAEMMAGLRASCPTIKHVLSYGSELPEGVIALDKALAEVSDSDRSAVDDYVRGAGVTADDVFTVCWTSGTESRPKGVPRSGNEWLMQSQGVIDGPRLVAGQRVLNPFPMVNMAGIAGGFMTWLLSGATLIQHHPFDLKVFLEQIRSERPNYSCAAPALLNMLLQQPQLLEGISFDTLRYIGSGSAPLSEWMIREFHERFGVQILNNFGSNEGMSLLGTDRDIPEPAMRAAYFPRIGRPGFTWDCNVATKITTRLVDPATETEITEPGQPGEMRIKGPSVIYGYWREPELTARAFDAEGYFKSGDTFEIAGDKNQYYKFAGRSKDLVIRGGMNISPDELESLLQGHPKVREVAIVGWPDALMGERVCACVATAPGETITLEEVIAWLRDEKQIAAFKLPEHLLLIDELPRNPVGKVLKRDLRDRVNALAEKKEG